jgi:hypothetical protein
MVRPTFERHFRNRSDVQNDLWHKERTIILLGRPIKLWMLCHLRAESAPLFVKRNKYVEAFVSTFERIRSIC